jgi:hypothetical protein
MFKNLKFCRQKTRRVADLHHSFADPGPDPAFYFDEDPDTALTKVMQICDHWSPDTPAGLHFEPPDLHCGRPWLHFEPLKLLNFYFNADSEPAIHLLRILDKDTAFKNF